MDGRDENASGTLGGRAYALRAGPVLLLPYVATFWMRSRHYDLYANGRQTMLSMLAVGLAILICTVLLGWLGIRRVRASGATEALVACSVVPWVQIIAVPWLAFGRPNGRENEPCNFATLRGAMWGLAIAMGAELVLSLAFGAFGLTLFLATPFLVGFAGAYIAEREGGDAPILTGQGALLLAAAVLFGFAYEGLICLAMAYPIAMIATFIGSLFGMVWGRRARNRASLYSSIVLLPLMFAAEQAAPPLAQFHDVRSVEVAAPPAKVWQSIVHMGRIESAPAAPFGWGLAFPVAGHIAGEGVGAIRKGVFSTGVAYEKVTRWDTNRELWFDVLTNPPMMRETNPFGPVPPAHLDGYFTTGEARFSLAPLPGGKTRLTLATEHVLRIGPTAYFLPLARWAVEENKRRVLAHFAARAEAMAREVASEPLPDS